MNSVNTLPDLLHLNTLAHGVKVQLDLVPVPVCDQGVPDGYGDLPRDLASVSITWHDPRTQHDDRKYTDGPSLALGVAQVPISEQRARSVYESQDTQTYGLSLALTLTLPSSTVTTTSSSSLAAIVSFRLNSHASDATWLPTSKALLFTRSRAHAQSLALPFPPHTMSAVRIEFWPVTTCGGAAAAAQCLQATPEHVKMIALNHHSKAVPSAKAEHEGEADAYPSPASLLSSTHTSPAASQYAAFGGAQNASRVPPSPRVSHSGERQAWAHHSQARGQYYDDSDDSRNDYTAVTGSSNRHGQAVPDAAGSYDTTTNYPSRQDPPTLFPNSPSPSPSPWSQPNTKSRRAPRAAAPHASSSSYHAPLPGVRHGRIAKPIPPPTSSPSYKSYTASGIKQGDPPPSSPCCGAAAAAARLMRGMSVVYIASSGADHSKDAEGGAGAGAGRIRVAIIKTPVGMRDFVHEF